jgi:ADP-dependent NAD(P)H-hydrate dehydratase / NAD(P)H-hydrate epimerase
MEPIYRNHEIRDIEAHAVIEQDTPSLMERAGLAAANYARDYLLQGKKKILVLAGPGNNGGDGFVAATHFRRWRFDVSVIFLGDESKLSKDARGALMEWRAEGGAVLTEVPRLEDWDLVVDALFGIGLERDIAPPYTGLIDLINRQTCPRFALDIPSGLHADSGRVMGIGVQATHTLTFLGLKPGLLTLDGPDHCGNLVVDTLGLASLPTPRGRTIDEIILRSLLPMRRRNTHKGSYGSLGLVGGAPGMTGAALLAGRAALRLGTGRVYVGFLGAAPQMDPLNPELMLRGAGDILALPHLSAYAVGPGFGTSEAARDILQRLLPAERPMVIDADALNLIASDTSLREQCQARTAPTIVTPHPADAARLLGGTVEEVQGDRVPVAITLAMELNAHVVLKGAGSVCATPGGLWFINRSGNPGLASAGSGDVLTGFIGALLAQGVEARKALLGAVHLHGKAADVLVGKGVGPIGLTASETVDAARDLLNQH